VENFGKRPVVTNLRVNPSCENSVLLAAVGVLENSQPESFAQPLHSFHILPTEQLREEASVPWKTCKQSTLTAQLLRQFIEQPV
jgi:hypothetical protein